MAAVITPPRLVQTALMRGLRGDSGFASRIAAEQQRFAATPKGVFSAAGRLRRNCHEREGGFAGLKAQRRPQRRVVAVQIAEGAQLPVRRDPGGEIGDVHGNLAFERHMLLDA